MEWWGSRGNVLNHSQEKAMPGDLDLIQAWPVGSSLTADISAFWPSQDTSGWKEGTESPSNYLKKRGSVQKVHPLGNPWKSRAKIKTDLGGQNQNLSGTLCSTSSLYLHQQDSKDVWALNSLCLYALVPCYAKCGPGTYIIASPELVRMQTLRPHSSPTEAGSAS